MTPFEKKLLKYMQVRGWDKQIPADVAKSIMIEGAELLEHFQWDHLSVDEIKKDKKKLEEIQNELADVLIYSLEMSILFGFDTDKIVRRKLAYAEKKYPVALIQKSKEASQNKRVYLEIKKMHRKQGKK